MTVSTPHTIEEMMPDDGQAALTTGLEVNQAEGDSQHTAFRNEVP